jgi:hypothetical protein
MSKYLFWQTKIFYLESFSKNVNLIKQKHYLESIDMIILKFIINIHNYQLSFYHNYNDNQLYICIYNINRYF